MIREELIEELHRLCDETDIETSEATQGWLVGNIRAALARFEKAQAPTDDERAELLAEADDLVSRWDRAGSWTPDLPIGLVMRLARFIRRPAQTEPTDAQVKAAIQGRYAAFRRNVNATETHLMRAALEAAFTAGQEEQS